MQFTTIVEPNEPMRGLEVPPAVIEKLGNGKRPRITVSINGHSWTTRIAIMRGRNLIGLSNANRAAAGLGVGQDVDVDISLASEPQTLEVPSDVVAALDGSPGARQRFDLLTISQRTQHIRLIGQAKSAETRSRRIQQLVQSLIATQ